MEENDKLPLTELEEEEMPEIVCIGCGENHQIVYQGYIFGSKRVLNGIIRGVLTCNANTGTHDRYSPCGVRTLFELTSNAISWAPGNIFHEDLSTSTSPTVRALFEEAVSAFYGGAYKGVVT